VVIILCVSPPPNNKPLKTSSREGAAVVTESAHRSNEVTALQSGGVATPRIDAVQVRFFNILIDCLIFVVVTKCIFQGHAYHAAQQNLNDHSCHKVRKDQYRRSH